MKHSRLNWRIHSLLQLPLAAALMIGDPISPIQLLNADCGSSDPHVTATIKEVEYDKLPAEVKRLMTNNHCNVTTGSNYDYGYSLDLNGDGLPEYAVCCSEAPHGPCGMSIFGQRQGEWSVLLNSLLGYETPDGFIVLPEQDDGYHRICQDRRIYAYRSGRYTPVDSRHAHRTERLSP